MKRRPLHPAVMAAAALGLAGNATPAPPAKPVCIELTAEVTQVTDDGGFLTSVVEVGDEITARYVYDAKAPDANPDPTIGHYAHTTAGFGITVDVNGFLFRTDPADVDFIVEVANNSSGQDGYALHSSSNIFDVAVPGAVVNRIDWDLIDLTTTALSNDNLPKKPPTLEDFAFANFEILSANGDFFRIRARVTSAEFCSDSE